MAKITFVVGTASVFLYFGLLCVLFCFFVRRKTKGIVKFYCGCHHYLSLLSMYKSSMPGDNPTIVCDQGTGTGERVNIGDGRELSILCYYLRAKLIMKRRRVAFKNCKVVDI